MSTNQRWSRTTPLPDFLASEKPDQQFNAHFYTHVWGYGSGRAMSTIQRWSHTTPLPDFFASEKPDQQFNAHFHTHINGGIGLDGIDQQINASPNRHPSRIFLLQTNLINNSTLIFTPTCEGRGLDGLSQQINASQDLHLVRMGVCMICVLFNQQFNGHPDHASAGNFFGCNIYIVSRWGGGHPPPY